LFPSPICVSLLCMLLHFLVCSKKLFGFKQKEGIFTKGVEYNWLVCVRTNLFCTCSYFARFFLKYQRLGTL
jgi:hypothetical protein